MLNQAKAAFFATAAAALLACSSISSATSSPPVAAQQANVLRRLGEDYARYGDLVRAEQYLVSALEAGAPSRQVLPTLLRVCVESRRYRVALEYAEDALRSEPGNSKLRFLTGSLYAATGDIVRAREQLGRAASELSSDPEVQYGMAVFARDQGQDPAQADHFFRVYLKLAPVGVHAAEAQNALMIRIN